MPRSLMSQLDSTYGTVKYHDEENIFDLVEQNEPQLRLMGITSITNHQSIIQSDYRDVKNFILVYMDGFNPSGMRLPVIQSSKQKVIEMDDTVLDRNHDARIDSQYDGSSNCESFRPWADVVIISKHSRHTIAVYFKPINTWYTVDMTHTYNDFTRMVFDTMMEATIGTPTADHLLEVLERGVQASDVLRLVDSKGNTYELTPTKVTNDGADARVKEMKSKFTAIVNAYIKGIDLSYKRKLKDIEKKLERITAPIPLATVHDLHDHGLVISGHSGDSLGLMVAMRNEIIVRYARVMTPSDGRDQVIELPEEYHYKCDCMVVLVTRFIPKDNNFQVTGIKLCNPEDWSGVSTGHMLGQYGEQCTGNLNLAEMKIPNTRDFCDHAVSYIEDAAELFRTFNSASPGNISTVGLKKMYTYILGKYHDRVHAQYTQRGTKVYLKYNIKRATQSEIERSGNQCSAVDNIPTDGKEPEYYKKDKEFIYECVSHDGGLAVVQGVNFGIRYDYLRLFPEAQIYGHEVRTPTGRHTTQDENLLWRT